MKGILNKTLAGAVALLFVLAYTGPLMLCGEACAGKAMAMSCCGASADAGAEALAHKCCCTVTDGTGRAVPPATPASYSGPDVPKGAVSATADRTFDLLTMAGHSDTVPRHTHSKSPPIYKQSCSYLC